MKKSAMQEDHERQRTGVIRRHSLMTTACIMAAWILALSARHGSFAAGEENRQIQAQKMSDTEVLPGVVYVKFRQSIALAKDATSTPFATINERLLRQRVLAIDKAFSNLDLNAGQAARSLSRVYRVRYAGGADPREMARELSRDPNVEYAEPQYIRELVAVPRDSLFNQQNFLAAVNLPAAWDVVKGEQGDVVIAIVDGGTDWRHEDLRANVWTNEDEIPDNGIDDDNNGFVDDIHGWNFASDSGDPTGLQNQPENGGHGTNSAGVAAAVSDNLIGVAGASWNCRFMPINASHPTQDNAIAFGFQGITYAAQNGAKIINCSWGSLRNRSTLEQEVIDVATELGALVVCAAGNDGKNSDESPFYPANYNNVLSVGGTDNAGRVTFSNYGASVDIYAPATFMLSTQPENKYIFVSGTSFSSPLVAGIAGLVRTLHPDWTPAQVHEQIRLSGQSLDARNPAKAGLLGKGQVDAFEAVTMTGTPAVRVAAARYTEAVDDGRIEVGETVTMHVTVTNALAAVGNMDLMFTALDSGVTLNGNTTSLAALASGDSATVDFQFSVSSELRSGQRLRFLLDISAANYTDRDFFAIFANPAQVRTHDTGTIRMSITSEGNIGFADFSGDGSPGEGFLLNGINLLFEGGLMLGAGSANVSDCIRGTDGGTQDQDFKSQGLLTIVSPGELADEEGEVIFDDSFAENPLQVRIAQKTFAFKQAPFDKFVVVRYTIENVGTQTLTGLFAGLFFDWDINEDANDFARYAPQQRLGYVLDDATQPRYIAGTKLLSSAGDVSYRSIDNPGEIYGGNSGNGFTRVEKWRFLSEGIQTQNLDSTDVSTLTATGPITLRMGESVEVAFAVIGAVSEAELFASAEAAQRLWDNKLVPDMIKAPPGITTSIFQNPAASKYADIVVVSDQLLDGVPRVHIWSGTDTTRIQMSPIAGAEKAFKGQFEFTTSANYTIRTQATGLLSNVDSTQTRDFAVVLARPGTPVSLTSTDHLATLSVPVGAVETETYFLAEKEEAAGATIYRFGPLVRFAQPVDLAIRYDPLNYRTPEELAIAIEQDGEWRVLPARHELAANVVHARTSMLGRFKLVAAGRNSGSGPLSYRLYQNYPNPFNPETRIAYDLPEQADILLAVYNTLGQVVRVLHRGSAPAGRYVATWDGRDARGLLSPTGFYFVRLVTPQFKQVRKMLLLK